MKRTSNRRRPAGRLIALLSVAAVFSSGPALAQTTDSFAVTATVVDACDITANDLGFGNYSPISGTDLDATSTIDVTCTSGASYTVTLDAGTTTGGAISARLMTDSTNTLGYNLYTTSARTTVWGDGSGASATITGSGSGSLESLTVYGRVTAGQSVPAGSYSDSVTAEITF